MTGTRARSVAVIGAALDLGQSRRGVDMGPSAIRYAGLEERLRSLGYAVHDHGNVKTVQPEGAVVANERARYLPEILETCASCPKPIGTVVERSEALTRAPQDRPERHGPLEPLQEREARLRQRRKKRPDRGV